jgi:hypothetical protein
MSVRGFVHVVCAARWGHLLDHMVEHNCLQAHTAPLPWFSLFSGTSMCKTCTQTCTRSIVRASLLYDALSRHLALQRTQLANLCLLLSKSASTAAQAGWRHRSSYCWPFKLCCPFIVNLCCPRILLGSRAVCTTWACPSWGGGVTHRVPVEACARGRAGGICGRVPALARTSPYFDQLDWCACAADRGVCSVVDSLPGSHWCACMWGRGALPCPSRVVTCLWMHMRTHITVLPRQTYDLPTWGFFAGCAQCFHVHPE